MAVCGPAFPNSRLREGVPNFSRITGFHAHLLHEFVEEVFSFRVEIGLELAVEVGEKACCQLQVLSLAGIAAPLGKRPRRRVKASVALPVVDRVVVSDATMPILCRSIE